jgi:hypothetical protein
MYALKSALETFALIQVIAHRQVPSLPPPCSQPLTNAS